MQYWPEVTPILLVGGVFLGGQALDAALLSPQIVGSKIGLHPVWLIFSLLVFATCSGSSACWWRCRSLQPSGCWCVSPSTRT